MYHRLLLARIIHFKKLTTQPHGTVRWRSAPTINGVVPARRVFPVSRKLTPNTPRRRTG
jgi:hypothetical protein